MADTDDIESLEMTVEIISSYVANNSVPSSDLPELIRSVHATILSLGETAPEEDVSQEPAVPVAKSITPDYLICLEDGRHLKMLKRYLRTRFDMTPEEYRAKWGLPADYPMVAPNYARLRSAHAREIGLGKKR